MKIGQRYNPHGMFHGIHIPNNLLRSTGLSLTAKCCWGRLKQYNGENNTCYPKQKDLATDLGVSLSSVRRAITELVENNYLELVKPSGYEKLMHRNNRYYFIWNENHESEGTPRSVQIGHSEGVQNEHSNIKESYIKESYNKSLLRKDSVSGETQNAPFVIKRRSLPSGTNLVGRSSGRFKDDIMNSMAGKIKLPSQFVLAVIKYWNDKGLRISPLSTSPKTYKKSCRAIEELSKGTIFNKSIFTESKNVKYNFTKIKLSIDNFALMSLDCNYVPADKKSISEVTLDRFIYNPSYKSKVVNGDSRYGVSYFLLCLDNPKKVIPNEEDKYPQYTISIAKEFKKRTGTKELTNKETNDFCRCANYWVEYFDTVRGRMIPPYCDINSEIEPYVLARWLLDSMEEKTSIRKVQPQWLYNDIAKKQLPLYLEDQGVMYDYDAYPQPASAQATAAMAEADAIANAEFMRINPDWKPATRNKWGGIAQDDDDIIEGGITRAELRSREASGEIMIKGEDGNY